MVDRRRALAALVGVVGVVLAVGARRGDGSARSTASDAMMGGTGGRATGGARGRAREGVDAADDGARTFEGARTRDDARSASETRGAVDLDALNERLSGSVWDFNEARPRTAAEKTAAGTREARPLPALGQTTRGERANRDVAEGESRSSSYSKQSDTNRAGTLWSTRIATARACASVRALLSGVKRPRGGGNIGGCCCCCNTVP